MLLTLSCQLNGQSGNDYNREVANKVGKAFAERYVFPETGLKIKELLEDKASNGAYDDFQDLSALGESIKEDIFSIANDKHVVVSYLEPKEGADEPEQGQRMQEFFNSLKNYGLDNSKVLDGNIGYMEIEIFYPLRMDAKAGDFAEKIMQKFKDTEAIIFDLRKCKGGDPSMLNLIISYLYPPGEKVHLNTFYYRPNDFSFDTYTLDEVDGPTYPEKPVYVLTSNTTFSCGEEFAYDIQQLERGTMVGETTGGGAHTVEPYLIDENFEINLPTGRAINPISKSNWEGTGVKPDIEVTADEALEKAISIIKNNN